MEDAPSVYVAICGYNAAAWLPVTLGAIPIGYGITESDISIGGRIGAIIFGAICSISGVLMFVVAIRSSNYYKAHQEQDDFHRKCQWVAVAIGFIFIIAAVVAVIRTPNS